MMTPLRMVPSRVGRCLRVSTPTSKPVPAFASGKMRQKDIQGIAAKDTDNGKSTRQHLEANALSRIEISKTKYMIPIPTSSLARSLNLSRVLSRRMPMTPYPGRSPRTSQFVWHDDLSSMDHLAKASSEFRVSRCLLTPLFCLKTEANGFQPQEWGIPTGVRRSRMMVGHVMQSNPMAERGSRADHSGPPPHPGSHGWAPGWGHANPGLMPQI
ncbi:uncharacterized protein BCR38DRAFT_406605 [Pseudomassariella vexata]|uniref:Uncharacterized protein n=1 Tax=Pseudomassariella vexata TaxID=1141098 RepID=A0A1Y2EAV3_9PEZI|nr:uncharacterized protein BCR38DRAFT_406605 [Pseudomassariella vexata]ORY68700.1 hypothetical protein BCR38DRAFT_406605 [Pseudomassariella vexata]